MIKTDAFISACRVGTISKVKELLADTGWDRAVPKADDSQALQSAAFHGRAEVVRLLLADRRPGRVVPNVLDSYALQTAAMRGHVEVVRLLLADPRTDRAMPNAQHSVALRSAATSGRTEVVRLLLQCQQPERALPSAGDSQALRFAALCQHVEVIRLLLADRRPHRALPNAFASAVLSISVVGGTFESVRLLLRDRSQDRALSDDADWCEDLEENPQRTKLVGLLLAHPPNSTEILPQLVRGFSPTVLRSMGIDRQLRHPVPPDNAWWPTQQRLLAWDQLERQLDEDDERRKKRTLARFAAQHGHGRIKAWLQEGIAARRERQERRLWLQNALPSARAYGSVLE